NSMYHAGNLRLEKRYSAGLNMLFNYTYAKYLDDIEGNSELAGLQGSGYQHHELRHLDRSYSGSDIRHRFAGSLVYELPFGEGRGFAFDNGVLDAFLGGGGVGVITELRTGSPYAVIENTNTSNTFSDTQRPNILRDPEQLPDWRDHVKDQPYFDPAV